MGVIHLQFEDKLAYQLRAVEAVCGLFKGAEKGSCAFSVQLPIGRRAEDNDLGIVVNAERNCLDETLSTQHIEENMREVQEENGISKEDGCKTLDFTIEMETGTGKTYVYLRTIYELNKRYGFKKFVIVVPSIAIKAGVDKTIENTREHFRKLYDGVEVESFTYDSKQLGNVRNFGVSSKLQIMICTIQSITEIDAKADKQGRGSQRVMHNEHEMMGGKKPIEYIRACRPIVIVDEPQRLGEKGKERGIAALHPLCTLRYSATHKELLHPLYKLTAVEAAQQKLVKSIEVASVLTDNMMSAFPYIRNLGTSKKKGGLAKLELRVRKKGGGYGIKSFEILPGTPLTSCADGWDVYEDFVLQEVHEDGSVQLVRRGEIYNLEKEGEWSSRGEEEQREWARAMIHVTIEEHMKKEIKLRPLGIKVLSLFFIDRVADYRKDGWLAKVFDEEYERIMKRPENNSLYERKFPLAHEVRGGYFSIDRHGKSEKHDETEWIDTSGKRGEKEAESRAYSLIMKDKEKLLNLEEPLKFIFTHSALREGWDNPNVFQVCVLRDIKAKDPRRQALGRGLRLCVDQSGKRVREEGVNVLTVISREDFEEYASRLQKEYEDDGYVFGLVDVGKMGCLHYVDSNGQERSLGQSLANIVKDDLDKKGLLKNDRPTATLREQLDHGEYELPVECKEASQAIMDYLKNLCHPIEIHNARERIIVKSRYEKFRLNTDFINLWNRIKKKTTYRVNFNSERLIQDVVKRLDEELQYVHRSKIRVENKEVIIDDSGVHEGNHRENQCRNVEGMPFPDTPVADIISALEEHTHLTRHTLCRIICGTQHWSKLKENYAEFERIASRVINEKLRMLMVDGISYEPVTIGETEYNAQEIFRDIEGYKDKIVSSLSKCVTDHVIFDSEIEKRFAEDAEKQKEIKIYTKLPAKFTINTPLGAYNPDWAIVVEKSGKDHLYFVAETKGVNLFDESLRGREEGKIKCAKKHFEKLHVDYRGPIKTLADLINSIP